MRELYDAFVKAAEHMGKEAVPYRRLVEAYGNDFSVSDIARLSHIPCRKVGVSARPLIRAGLPASPAPPERLPLPVQPEYPESGPSR